MRLRSARALLALVALSIWSTTAHAQRGSTALTTERVATGLSSPVYVTAPPNDPTRLFIVEQRGLIKILDLASLTVNAAPFLDLTAGGPTVTVSTSGSERGLLGMAFDPKYDANGYFYVSYTRNSDGSSVIRRYTVSANPDLADSTTGLVIYGPVSQPFTNHNGGCIQFGPDGTLYLGLGDGGSANDPSCRAQNGNDILGKMVRINPDGSVPADNPFVGGGDGFLDDIWAYGLRNPWRFSFDRGTGDLYIGDVGQGTIEEIDFVRSVSTGGENYGWKVMEGNNCFSTSACSSPPTCGSSSYTDPVHTYTHSGGNCSVTGGYVYRGCAMPDMQGIYFFGDFCSTSIWSFEISGGTVTNFTDRTTELEPPGAPTILSISSFGEDALGEIYIVDISGDVFRIIPDGGITDTNSNNIADSCEADSATRNGSGVNPNVLTEITAPILGTTWETDVDLVAGGALASVLILELGGPINGPVLSGTFSGQLLGLPPFANLGASGSGSHLVPLPLDLSFLSVSMSAQALLFNPGSFGFTNAIDVTFGL